MGDWYNNDADSDHAMPPAADHEVVGDAADSANILFGIKFQVYRIVCFHLFFSSIFYWFYFILFCLNRVKYFVIRSKLTILYCMVRIYNHVWVDVKKLRRTRTWLWTSYFLSTLSSMVLVLWLCLSWTAWIRSTIVLMPYLAKIVKKKVNSHAIWN